MIQTPVRPKGGHALALFLFPLLAILLTAPALFSGGERVCASNAPDTWVHLWAFWRTSNALLGNDIGYFVSHVITYPGIMREPIAVFDPLLSLAAAGLYAGVRSIPIVFNLLVTLGLAFTGMSGYLLATQFTRRQGAAIIGGIIAAANPFIYRQITAGYAEYAWWGLVPFTIWLYLKAITQRRPGATAGYIVSLLLTFLLSIYCAAILVAFLACAFAYEVFQALRLQRRRVRRAFRLQLMAVICLLPVLFFWFHHLELMGYRGIPVNEAFSPRDVQTIEDLSQRDERVGIEELQLFSTWRTLHGSLDASDMLSLTTHWRAKEEQRRDRPHPIPFLAGADFAYSEAVFAIEWIVPLLLALVALAHPDRQDNTIAWLVGALLFLVLALGPFLTWDGKVLTGVPLPYAWLYRWIPGFARLNIPGRAFLGTLLCLIAPTAQGATILVNATLHRRPGSARQRYLLLGLVLLASFSLTGYARLTLPTTPISVPSVYHRIATDREAVALLELPIRGELDRRMFYQSIHGKPIHRAIPATFMTEIEGMGAVESNPLVVALNMDAPRLARDIDSAAALRALRNEGFAYLLLHADGYESPSAYDAACGIARDLLGPPFDRGRRVTAWKLTP